MVPVRDEHERDEAAEETIEDLEAPPRRSPASPAAGVRDNQPNLFNWWNFWHRYLGKCGPLPHCVALLP